MSGGDEGDVGHDVPQRAEVAGVEAAAGRAAVTAADAGETVAAAAAVGDGCVG